MDAWQATEEFGRALGLPGLNLESGQTTLEIEDGATLGLLLCDRDLLVTIVQPVPHPHDSLPIRALQSGEARDLPGFALQVGSRGSGAEFCLVGAVRLTEQQLSATTLISVAERLMAWADRLREPR